jgi:hypothetical protein
MMEVPRYTSFAFMSRLPDTPDARHQAQMPGMPPITRIRRETQTMIA